MLGPLLGILKEREVGGSARQMLGASADALHEMEARPDKSFKCGPFGRELSARPDAVLRVLCQESSLRHYLLLIERVIAQASQWC